MIKLDKHRIYYTYVLMDPRFPGNFVYDDIDPNKEWTFNFQPFYIGKGKNHRLNGHTSSTTSYNKHKARRIAKIEKEGFSVIRLLVEARLTEKQAYLLEKHLIRTIGRRHLKEGPLTNLTQGGVGVADLEKAAMRRRVNARQNKSPEELKMIKAKQVAAFKETIKSRTDKEKEAWSETMRQMHKNRPDSYKRKIVEKRLASLDTQKLSKNLRKAWSKKTPEQKAAITEKRLATRLARQKENPGIYKRSNK